MTQISNIPALLSSFYDNNHYKEVNKNKYTNILESSSQKVEKVNLDEIEREDILTTLLGVEAIEQGKTRYVDPDSPPKFMNELILSLSKDDMNKFMSDAKKELKSTLQVHIDKDADKDIKVPQTLEGMVKLSKRYNLDLNDFNSKLEDNIKKMAQSILASITQTKSILSTEDLLNLLPNEAKKV